MTPIEKPATHYPTSGAKCADLIVHIAGLAFALFGGGILLGLSVGFGTMGQTAAVAIYTVGLMTMFGCSMAYNFGKWSWRPVLRRFDHAAIFVMIAGSYTPFTTQNLEGAWSIGMTSAVWTLALLGVAGKLFLPGLGRKFWIGLYIALGWIVLVALQPMLDGVSWVAMLLLGIGGVVYSTGIIFYLMKKFRFRRAVWHGHVLAGAAVQYAAVMVGVLFANGH